MNTRAVALRIGRQSARLVREIHVLHMLSVHMVRIKYNFFVEHVLRKSVLLGGSDLKSLAAVPFLIIKS